MDRKELLLRKCLELLERQNESNYILDLLSETVVYDETIDRLENIIKIKEGIER